MVLFTLRTRLLAYNHETNNLTVLAPFIAVDFLVTKEDWKTNMVYQFLTLK